MSILHSANWDFYESIRYLRLNASFVWLKSRESGGLRNLKNNLPMAVTRQFCWCVSPITMTTLLWFTSVLQVLSFNVTNWLISEKKISTLVTLVSLNNKAGCWAAVKVILPMRMKLANATLNSALMLSLSPSVGWSLVIWRKISLVIGKRMDFVLRKNRLPPLIRRLSRGASNCCTEFLGLYGRLKAISNRTVQS